MGDQQEEEIDIMESLHQKKMFTIHKEFEKNPDGLEITEFVEVMLNHLEYEKSRKMEFTLALIDLFKDIDVNDDGSMEWNEFSNHIIELGLVRKDKTFKNVIKSYYPSEQFQDNEKHENEVDKVNLRNQVYYFGDKMKAFMILEKESSKFKVYNSNTGKLIQEVKAHKSPILAAEYIPDLNMVVTSSNDLTVNFWDSQNFALKQVLSVPEIQLAVKYANWSNNCQLLYLGGSDATVRYYDVNTLKERGTISAWNPFYKKDSVQPGHQGPISDILPIFSQQTLVTAGLDGKICLWDFPTHTFKKELQGHDKGVYSLDWSEWSPMNNCLISAGFDHDAYVWNTYVREKIFLLRGHNHPLVGVKCLPNSPQVVTADIKGMVKVKNLIQVWDVRNFMCMQTFNVPVDEVNSFCLTYPKKRIVVAEKCLNFYDYDEPKDQYLTDESVCVKVIYSKLYAQFITLHPHGVKVWNDKGELIRVHRGLCKGELTGCVMDNRELKLFVGNSDGKLFTINLKNGAKMNKFKKHKQMVTDVIYWKSLSEDKDQQIKRVISGSRDNCVNFHDEDAFLGQSLRSSIQNHQSHINNLSIMGEILASCADNGSIILTNLNTSRQDFLCNHSCELKRLKFLEPHRCLVACDSKGAVLFFTTQNTTMKDKLLCTKQFKTNSLTNKLMDAPVQALGFYESQNHLILGDEFGYICIWDIDVLIKKNNHVKQAKQSIIQQKEAAKLANTLQENQLAFLTETKSASLFDQEQLFFTEDDINVLRLIKCHSSVVSSIAVIEKEKAFATSSLDCCVHIWSLTSYNKLGSLILAQSNNLWNLKIDKSEQEKKKLDFATGVLKQINQFDSKYKESNSQSGQNSSRKKENILSSARNLIQRGKILKENNWEMDEYEDDERIDNQLLFNDQEILNELGPVKGGTSNFKRG